MATALNATLNDVDINSIINVIKPMLPYIGLVAGAAGSFKAGLIGSGIFLGNAALLASAGAISLGFGAGTLMMSIPALITAAGALLTVLGITL